MLGPDPLPVDVEHLESAEVVLKEHGDAGVVRVLTAAGEAELDVAYKMDLMLLTDQVL